MIRIKHLFDSIDAGDGERMWIEPIGLTKDLSEWCAIGHVLTNLGPPLELWKWYEEHPDGYEYFRGKYHEHLSAPQRRRMLLTLAAAGVHENFTLIHQGDDLEHNSATALYEFLSELQAYTQPE